MEHKDLFDLTFSQPASAYRMATARPDWAEKLEMIPPHMRGGLVRYVVFGLLPGSFLVSLLEGNLFRAMQKADDTNRKAIENYATFLQNYAPAGCYGSPENVETWSSIGGLYTNRKEI